MNRQLQLLINASAVSALAFSASAAEPTALPQAKQPATAWENPAHTRAGQPSQPHTSSKASDIVGMNVHNHQGEKIGKVKDLALDIATGRIVAVIVATGDFLGIDKELSAIPPTALRLNPERAALQVNASKDSLTRAPRFQANKWPNFGDAAYSDSVDRAYNIAPPVAATAPTPAHAVQGSSKADVATTAQIRKEIRATKNLSVNAQNVTISANDGNVTLRGPVDTAEEKRQLGAIADRIARPANVDNQIEVRQTTSSSR